MFLVDANSFSEEVKAGGTTATGDARHQEELVAIVDKYIRDDSPYEVNIECKTKTAIISATERTTFDELTLVNKSNGCARVFTVEYFL